MSTTSTPETRLVVPESVRAEIVAHAREGAPEEVCGILAGTREAGDEPDDQSAEHRVEDCHRVEARHPAENVADRPRTRYAIDPREQLELMEAIEDAGREVVGFYHSHPRGPAEPSATDAAQATWPDRSYVIVSLGRPDGEESVGSWRWTDEKFVAEEVRVVDDGRA